MGFFSALCPGCQHSIRSQASTREVSLWMQQAVVLFENGDRISGEYDGYGRVGHADEVVGMGENEVWHRACWTLAGKPEFTKPSPDAHDQGYFVGEYDPEEPKSQTDLDALKAFATKEREERRAKAKKEREEYIAELRAKGEEVPAWLLGSSN